MGKFDNSAGKSEQHLKREKAFPRKPEQGALRRPYVIEILDLEACAFSQSNSFGRIALVDILINTYCEYTPL